MLDVVRSSVLFYYGDFSVLFYFIMEILVLYCDFIVILYYVLI